MCAYTYECHICYVFYKVICKCCGDFYFGNTQNKQKRIKQHFQDMAQKFIHIKNLDSFAAHFAKHFTQNQVHNFVVKLCFSKYFLW